MLCLGGPPREARPGIVSGEKDQDSSAQAEDEHLHMQLLQNSHGALTLGKKSVYTLCCFSYI